jgi:hypothetical protein
MVYDAGTPSSPLLGVPSLMHDMQSTSTAMTMLSAEAEG